MRAGALNQLITLQRRVEARNDAGEVTWTWQDWETVWAAVEPLRSRELFSAQQVQSQSTLLVRIRHLSGVKATMRIVHITDDSSPGETRYYQIDGPPINVRTGNDEMQLLCSELEAEGWRN